MSEIVKILLMVLLSSVKYLFAVLPLLAASSRPWYFDMFIVITGGSTGVLVFTYLGAMISKYFEKFHYFRIKYPKLKKLVHIKNSYGLIGLAVISPMIISIPIGCIISTAFEHDKKKIIRLQITSVICWSFILFGLKGLFHIDISKAI